MKQSWRKLGQIYCPSCEESWLFSHASNPVADYLGSNEYRIYFSSRDKANRGQISSINIRIVGTKVSVIDDTKTHVLSHGENGHFDDSGVTVNAILKRNSKIYLYYLGWNLCQTIPFRNSIGLAVSKDNGLTFQRYSSAPIVDRCSHDPISLSYPFILKDDSIYRIWYGSCEEWNGNSVDDYFFSIKYAESKDAIHWKKTNKFSIRCNRNLEDAIARPHVIKEDSLYKMWYSTKKGRNYSIGYAESSDGIEWQRLDKECSIDVSKNGWDSEMIEYPFVFNHGENRYMLYNGNDYGRTGFGIAILDK